jgi:hypothetical protein
MESTYGLLNSTKWTVIFHFGFWDSAFVFSASSIREKAGAEGGGAQQSTPAVKDWQERKNRMFHQVNGETRHQQAGQRIHG